MPVGGVGEVVGFSMLLRSSCGLFADYKSVAHPIGVRTAQTNVAPPSGAAPSSRRTAPACAPPAARGPQTGVTESAAGARRPPPPPHLTATQAICCRGGWGTGASRHASNVTFEGGQMSPDSTSGEQTPVLVPPWGGVNTIFTPPSMEALAGQFSIMTDLKRHFLTAVKGGGQTTDVIHTDGDFPKLGKPSHSRSIARQVSSTGSRR